MQLIVKKFGGTSLGTVERIKNVAKLVANFSAQHQGTALCIVVSAMAGETNRLVELSKSLASVPQPREVDLVLASGEQVAAGLLSIALNSLGAKARSFDGRQAHIMTNIAHQDARIERIDGSALRATLNRGEIAVVTGFQGVNKDGEVTTLGRGGSDISAVALASALNADACYIYTDVDGVYSADPNICPKARRLKRISHEEMLELAGQGAKVLHPRSVYFALRYQVPLLVLSTFGSQGGTWIVKEEALMEKPVVSGIAHKVDEAMISVQSLPGGTKALRQIVGELAAHEILIDMCTQSLGTDNLANLSFTVSDQDSSKAFALLQRLAPELGAQGVSITRDIAKVSVIGAGMRFSAQVSARLFEALEANQIEIKMLATSEIRISVIIPRKFCEMAVRALHQSLIEDTLASSANHAG